MAMPCWRQPMLFLPHQTRRGRQPGERGYRPPGRWRYRRAIHCHGGHGATHQRAGEEPLSAVQYSALPGGNTLAASRWCWSVPLTPVNTKGKRSESFEAFRIAWRWNDLKTGQDRGKARVWRDQRFAGRQTPRHAILPRQECSGVGHRRAFRGNRTGSNPYLPVRLSSKAAHRSIAGLHWTACDPRECQRRAIQHTTAPAPPSATR